LESSRLQTLQEREQRPAMNALTLRIVKFRVILGLPEAPGEHLGWQAVRVGLGQALSQVVDVDQPCLRSVLLIDGDYRLVAVELHGDDGRRYLEHDRRALPVGVPYLHGPLRGRGGDARAVLAPDRGEDRVRVRPHDRRAAAIRVPDAGRTILGRG